MTSISTPSLSPPSIHLRWYGYSVLVTDSSFLLLIVIPCVHEEQEVKVNLAPKSNTLTLLSSKDEIDGTEVMGLSSSQLRDRISRIQHADTAGDAGFDDDEDPFLTALAVEESGVCLLCCSDAHLLVNLSHLLLLLWALYRGHESHGASAAGARPREVFAAGGSLAGARHGSHADGCLRQLGVLLLLCVVAIPTPLYAMLCRVGLCCS